MDVWAVLLAWLVPRHDRVDMAGPAAGRGMSCGRAG